jgi:hypothetical protein
MKILTRSLFIFGLITAAIVFWKLGYLKKGSELKTLRVSFPNAKPAREYEPTRIHLAPEYIFLENIYSPLVEITVSNKLEAGLAEHFMWHGDELHLKIRKAKTIGGNLITPEDVVFSLKRILIKSENTHGNFKDIVCPNVSLKKIDQLCDGITYSGDTVILKAKKSKSFLLPMLAAIDFAIIPKAAVDPSSLEIIDYRETSGPYYVEKDSELGKIILKANPQHYRYSLNMPQEIQLVPTDPKNISSSLNDLESGKVDYVSTIDANRPEDMIQYSLAHKDVNQFASMNIRTFVLVFTQRGIDEIPESDRIAIGEQVRKALGEVWLSLPGYKETIQFIPEFGEGGLPPEKETLLREKFAISKLHDAQKKLSLWYVRVGSGDKLINKLATATPYLKVSEGPNVPGFLKFENSKDMPHMFIGGPDSGFTEDISLLSYSLASGIFGKSRAEGEKWLANYMSVSDKEKRLALLKQIHFDSINNGILVPIANAPYVAIARKPWKIGLSQQYANNPLWLIFNQ